VLPATLSGKAIKNVGSIETEVLTFSLDKYWQSLAPDVSRLPAEPGWTDPRYVYYLQFSKVDLLQPLQQYCGCNISYYIQGITSK
jgi:hypothetical protein